MEILLFTGCLSWRTLPASTDASSVRHDGNPVRELFATNNLYTSARSVEEGSVFECFAKAIVYATQPIHLTDELIAELSRIEGLSDRPYAPQLIELGHPIASVRGGLKCGLANQIEEENRVQLLEDLRERAERVMRMLGDRGFC
jgi:predicted ATP-grasp superfamily ATP-dependent carboligase